MIKVINGNETGKNIFNSTAHVFVKFVSPENGIMFEPCDGVKEEIARICSKVNRREREGRLWVFPYQQEWPPEMGDHTPNNKKQRTVWAALIPMQENELSGGFRCSLRLLDKWLESTGLNLRVAIDNMGQYYMMKNYHCPGQASRISYMTEQVKKYLGRWDVEVYEFEYKEPESLKFLREMGLSK